MPESGPFVSQRAPRMAHLRRLLRRRGTASARVELNNLFVGRPARSVMQAEIEAVCRRHRVDLRRDLGATAERLYRAFLAYCLEDSQLGDDELCDLAHLQRILSVNDRTADAIHDYVARKVYCESVSEALDDGRIDPAEREFLQRLQQHLELPDRVAAKIIESKQRARWAADVPAAEGADDAPSPAP